MILNLATYKNNINIVIHVYTEEPPTEFAFSIPQDNLDYDQMIWEFGTDKNPDWVHVSYVDVDSNRRRCLQAYKDDNNKTCYKEI